MDKLSREANRLHSKLNEYIQKSGLSLDEIHKQIQDKTCPLPARVREYVIAFFKVAEYESKRTENQSPSKPE